MSRDTIPTRLSPELIERYTASGHWRHDTIYALARSHAGRAPDSFAVRDSVRRITYRQLIDAADALASDLASHGIEPGQRVAMWLPSRIESVVALLACSRDGTICCPSLHRDHTVGEIVELLQRTSAAALIVQRGYGADAGKRDLMAALKDVPTLRHVYRLEPHSERNTAAFAGIDAGSAEAPKKSDPNSVVYLAFTSGTTGRPKGVMHSDNTLLANARQLAGDWRIDHTSVVFSLSPLSHNLGFGAQVMALAMGGELVINDLPRGASLADRILETGTSFLVGVPPNAIDLLAEMQRRNLKGLGRLTGFRISGSAVPGEVVAGLIRQGIRPQSGYGMTESCSHQYTLPDDDAKLIIETSGKTCPGYELRIFSNDDPDREVPHSTVGQMGGRGASLMLGYFEDPTATQDAFNAGGWFMTGDLGSIDGNGYLRIAGRSKDIIIRGGHNIHPARIEELATRHAAVQRAAAVPVKDVRLGEKVCLAVVFRAGESILPDELLAHLDAAGLSKFDMPEYFLALDEIPLTPNGKMFKRAITDDIAQDRVTPLPVRWQTKPASRGESMRAVMVREFGDIENAALGDMPKPGPKAGEVLLQVKSTAVNFVDLVMMSGTYQFKPQLPFVPGKLPVGVVAAVGAGVTQFKPGDHAIAMAEQGGFAEFSVVPEGQCVRLPPLLPFEEAAAMSLIYDTAYFALKDRARFKPGESVLVLGATGGVGLAAIQLVKAMGGIALAGVASKDKESIVREAGADHVIDLAAPDLKESVRAQVFEKVGRQGVDIVIDMLGGDHFDAAVRALAWCGRLVVIGFASGRIPSIKANYILVKNIEISGMQISDYRKRRPADMQACFKQIFEWHGAGKLKPLPTRVYPIEQFAEAMKEIRDRRQRGRVVLNQAG